MSIFNFFCPDSVFFCYFKTQLKAGARIFLRGGVFIQIAAIIWIGVEMFYPIQVMIGNIFTDSYLLKTINRLQ